MVFMFRQYSHTMGRLGKLRKDDDEDSNYNYPWVFYDPDKQEKKSANNLIGISQPINFIHDDLQYYRKAS